MCPIDGRRIVAAAVLLSIGVLAGAAQAQPMGSSLPGRSASPPTAPAAPGSSIGVDTISSGTRSIAAQKCVKLAGAEKEKCLREARVSGEPDPDAATQSKGSSDRVGPTSTGMGSGAGGPR